MIKLWLDFQTADLFGQAAAMVYTTLLSLVPSLAAVFIVLSLFNPIENISGGQNFTQIARDFLVQNLTPDSADQVSKIIDSLIANLSIAKIGITSVVGLFISLSLLLRQIELALNKVFGIRTERNLFKRFTHFWTFMTLGIFLTSVGTGILTGFNIDPGAWLHGTSEPSAGEKWTSALAELTFTFAIFFSLYLIVPYTKVRKKPAAIAAITVTLLFQVCQWGFGIYVNIFSKQEAIYGALAALPVFLMWLYICWIVILLGGYIAARYQYGFLSENTSDEVQAHNLATSYRNKLLTAYFPILCFCEIHRAFQEKGAATSEALAQKLNCPETDISEACLYLQELGFIRLDHENQDRWFPTKGSQAYKMSDIAKVIWPEISRHLEDFISVPLTKKIGFISESIYKEESLDQVIERF